VSEAEPVEGSEQESQPPAAPVWEDIFGEPFTVLILGERGGGKTALGHELMERFGGPDSDRDAYIMGFPDHLRDLLPEWVEILPDHTDMDNWPQDSVVLMHEPHHLIHARRSMDAENLSIDNLVTVSRHKNSNIVFETQQSQRLDRNAVTAVDGIIFRQPALMQAEFERKQMRKLVKKAEKVFDKYVETVVTEDFTWRDTSDEVKKHAYVYSGRFDGEYPHEIDLADHWTEEISKAYGEVPSSDSESGGSPVEDTLSDKEQEGLDAVAEWETEERPLSYEHSGATYEDLPHPHGWTTLSTLNGMGLLEQTFSPNNSSNRYRMTEDGWEKSTLDEPDADLFDDSVDE